MPLSTRPVFALVLLGVVAPAALPAQEPYLVADFSTPPVREKGLASTEVLAASSGLYYSFDDGIHGPELWRSNGSSTSLVRDLCPGPCGSRPGNFAEHDGKIYFFADDGATGMELWRTDGTSGGTTLLRDFCPGSCGSGPSSSRAVVSAGDALFIRAADDGGRVGLWTSDGTSAGTHRVADICPDCNAGIYDLTAAGGSVFFRADDGVHGVEIWRSDGISTAMLRDDCPGSCSSGDAEDEPDMFTPYGNDLFYWQQLEPDPNPDPYLARWRLRSTGGDAVEQGHTIDIDSYYFPRLAVVGSSLLVTSEYFFLQRIDVPTFTSTTVHTFSHPVGETEALGNAAVFLGYVDGQGYELWRSDGTDAGTELLAHGIQGLEADLLVVAAGKVYFVVEEGNTIWVSDGTAVGTHGLDHPWGSSHVAGLTPDPIGQRLLFTSSAELWATNGSSSQLVRSLHDYPGPAPASLGTLTAFAGALFYSPGSGLWRSDGSPRGTTLLSDRASLADPAPFQGGLLFRSGTIWKTDGTPAGTRPLLDVHFAADNLQVAGGRLFSSGHPDIPPDDLVGHELWSSDGTPEGTRLLKDIAPGTSPSPLGPQPNSSRPRQLTAVGSTLYFVADSPEFGTEIWSSDGTPEGTTLLADRCPGPCSSEQQLLGAYAGRLLFTSGFSLWATNPGAPGFVRIRQLGHSSPDPVTFRGRLFFFAEDAGGREHLWSTNGTPAGTVRVQEISGLDQPRTAHEPAIVGDRLYFTSWTEAAGQEVWVSDGTAGGTHLFADVRPGPEGSTPRHLTAVGRRLFFAADDGTAGQELWMTDGTATGTRRVADIAPGPSSAAPADLTAAGGLLFFSAVDSTNSRDLWALDTTQLFAHCVPAADRLCLDGRRFSVTVRFLDPRAGGTEKSATAIPDSEESGFFWFFDRGNLELVVKVLDGRAANGHFWVLFGALSDVEYTVTVTDHATGAVRTYHNPHGTLCGQADTAAFTDPAGATAPARFVPHPAISANAAEPAGPCTPGPSQLCLGGGRFRVEAHWKDQHSGGQEGTAFAVPRTDESGSFWFFSPGNTELVVKVLDGTPVNGKFWIFYGALSDVEYWLTVTDTVTGAVKTYHNPPGNYCGRGDTDGL